MADDEKKFKGSNSLSNTRELFVQRLKYRTEEENRYLSEKYPNYLRFNLFEYTMYGRISRSHLPMDLNKERTDTPDETLRMISTGPSGGQAIRVINFVADAFEDFLNVHNKNVIKGNLKEDQDYLSGITAYKGYISADSLYEQHRRMVYDSVKQHITKHNSRIENFDEFIVFLQKLLEYAVGRIPFTKSGFMKSRFCPQHTSGLMIDIANIKYDYDQGKYDKFVASPNFEFYLNNALNHGFFVDLDAPWRLQADIGSPGMMKYMEQHGITETDQVFSKYYDLTAVEDYELFKRTIIGYYNSYVQAFPYEPKPVECKDGTTMIKAIVPKPISTEEVMIKYPEKYWFRLYFKIRNIESDSALSPTRFEHVYRNLSNMLDSYYMRDILSFMETTMADLSDETGSMHQFLERVDALGDEAAEREIVTTEATTIESADVGVDLLEVTGRTDY
tara:strand:- start:2121 stop:3461 length:1341 start_codon:yes stop_codon:yes gene_type:complete